MSLVVYNDLTRKKEPFYTIEKGKVRFYVCGPNPFTIISTSAMPGRLSFLMYSRRYLESCGYEVIYVQNFTDIDDKMIKRANEMGITVAELAEKFIAAYYEDVRCSRYQKGHR